MSTLTPLEKRWLRKLQAVLDACPSNRLGFYTIGDPCIVVYDHDKEAEIEVFHEMDFCNAVDAADARFNYELRFPNCVCSTSG